MYTNVCIYSHCCCCCAARVRFGALYYFQASAASSGSAVILLCISGFGVVRWCLDIELSVSAWYQKTRRVPLRARRLLLLLLLLAAERGGVRHNLENFMQNKTTILCQSEHAKIPPHPKHTHIKKQFFNYGNSLYGPASWKHTKSNRSDIPSQLPTEQQRTSPPRSSVSEHMPRCPSCVCPPECSVS